MDQTTTNALIEAATHGHLDQVKAELAKGSDPNAFDTGGRTALHWAAQENRVAICEQLIAAGADVNAPDREHGCSPLSIAASEGHTKLVRTLIRRGAAVNVRANATGEGSILSLCCAYDLLETIKVLVEEGNADLHTVDEDGETPLSIAIDSEFHDLAKYLKAHDAA